MASENAVQENTSEHTPPGSGGSTLIVGPMVRLRPRGSAFTILAVALVAVLLGIGAVVAFGARALPWQSGAERYAERQDGVRAAAKAGVIAFLDVDYRDMASRIEAVKKLSTGTFKKQYAATEVDLKAAAEQAQARSIGSVSHVALNSLGPTSATVLVTAENVVSNTDTTKVEATQECPHAGARCDGYRFVVSMTKVGDRWLLSDLAGAS